MDPFWFFTRTDRSIRFSLSTIISRTRKYLFFDGVGRSLLSVSAICAMYRFRPSSSLWPSFATSFARSLALLCDLLCLVILSLLLLLGSHIDYHSHLDIHTYQTIPTACVSTSLVDVPKFDHNYSASGDVENALILSATTMICASSTLATETLSHLSSSRTSLPKE